uniref:N5-carboxyaminoimidazole ribonucleotide synthase n=2 Tax=Lygus hesperus TaxID=30085 RepID=A0A0A9W8E4_LYGHE
MQIVIEKITISERAPRPVWSGYYNDDACLIFEDIADARAYSDIDQKICQRMGFDFKKKSTFIAEKHAVLCELYAAEDRFANEKQAYYHIAFGNLMSAINASHARSIALSMNVYGLKKVITSQVLRYWGPVLYKGETTRHREAGGWFRSISRSVDFSFSELDGNSRLSQMEAAARYAYKKIRLIRKPWSKLNVPTKKSLIYPIEWLEQRGEKTVLEWDDVFRPSSDVTENVRSWIQYEKALRNCFSNACRDIEKNNLPAVYWRDIYKEVATSHPEEDILPPAGMYRVRTSEEMGVNSDIVFDNPYRGLPFEQDLAYYKLYPKTDCYPRLMGISDRISLGWVKNHSGEK